MQVTPCCGSFCVFAQQQHSLPRSITFLSGPLARMASPQAKTSTAHECRTSTLITGPSAIAARSCLLPVTHASRYDKRRRRLMQDCM